jgi:hypothetical protein
MEGKKKGDLETDLTIFKYYVLNRVGKSYYIFSF